MVTTPRHAPRPALHLSLRHFLRASNRTSPRKRRHSSRNRQNNDPPWRGNFRPWPALPRSGIRARLPLVPMDRSLPRRCPKHSRPLDDVYGRPLLAQRRSPPHRSLRAYTILGNLSSPRNLREPYHRNRRSPGHSTPLDHPSPPPSSLAPRVLHQWRPRLRQSSTLALPGLPLVGVRISRPGRRLLPLYKHRQTPRRSDLSGPGWDWHSGLSSFPEARRFPHRTLFQLRLLAHQPQFFPNALWHPPNYLILRLRLVPLGRSPTGIQPHHPTRQNLPPRLLGAHRIRLRAALYPAQTPIDRPRSHPRSLDHLSSHAAAFRGAHKLEESPSESAKAGRYALARVKMNFP